MKTRIALLTAAALAAATVPAIAHHSGAMFDRQSRLSLSGVVKDFQWTNPHAWLQVMVPNAAGVQEEWSFELTSPNILRRFGWGPDSVKPGDRVTIETNPMRDGSHGGDVVTVKLPDGKMLGGQGPIRSGGPGAG